MNGLIEDIPANTLSTYKSKMTINDFSMICVLGKGSYAEVILARKKDTNTIYALKILKKKKIEAKNQNGYVKNERNILIGMDHPFIIKLAYTFQNEKKLYFALEYCPGGELFNLLQKKGKFTEDQARFYVVQIILALECLHNKDILYRDLKPENVLIDQYGYIRITDFGLSKLGITGNKGANTICGTPEYLAPEILARFGHGKAVDWWTLGAILFEMVTGLPPFYSTNREEMFDRIRFGTLKYPNFLSKNLINLLEGLFKKDPNARLGGGSDGADEIKSHPWFDGVDWEAYYRKEIQAPFIPNISSDTDVQNFDPEFTEQPIESLENGYFGENSQNYPGWSYNGSNSLKKTSSPKSIKETNDEDRIDLEF